MGKAKWMLCVLAWITPFSLAGGTGQNDERNEVEKLSILYAGYPGGPREKAWLDFLGQWFENVESISLKDLDAKAASRSDVVVADWTTRYKDGSYNSEHPRHDTSLGKDFSRPIIMVSGVGAELTREMNLKTDWL